MFPESLRSRPVFRQHSLQRFTALVVTVSVLVVVCTCTGLPPRHVARVPVDANDNHRDAFARRDRVVWSSPFAAFRGLVISPDDRYLACLLEEPHVGPGFSRRLVVVDVESGKAMCEVFRGMVTTVGFTEDSKSLVILTRDATKRNNALRLFDIRAKSMTLEIDTTLDPGRLWEPAIGVSADGATVAIHAWDSEFRDCYMAWNSSSGQCVPCAPRDYIWTGGISSDGELITHSGWPGPGIRISRSYLNEDGKRDRVSFCLREDFRAGSEYHMPISTTFTFNSAALLVMYEEGTLWKWTIMKGARAQAQNIRGNREFMGCGHLALSHSGDKLFYACECGDVRVASLGAR